MRATYPVGCRFPDLEDVDRRRSWDACRCAMGPLPLLAVVEKVFVEGVRREV
jgi:hypothetical protein